MAIQIVPIIKALTPLIANASGIAAAVAQRRKGTGDLRTEDAIRRLEDDLIRTGEVLSGLAEQVAALAEEVRAQAELNERVAQRLKRRLWLSAGALAISVVALAGAFAF